MLITTKMKLLHNTTYLSVYPDRITCIAIYARSYHIEDKQQLMAYKVSGTVCHVIVCQDSVS